MGRPNLKLGLRVAEGSISNTQPPRHIHLNPEDQNASSKVHGRSRQARKVACHITTQLWQGEEGRKVISHTEAESYHIYCWLTGARAAILAHAVILGTELTHSLGYTPGKNQSGLMQLAQMLTQL